MAETVPPSIARVRLFDLIAVEGLPSESYKASISNLTQSFAQYSAAIIQLSSADGALLRSGLESARLFFHHRSYSPSEMVHTSDSREWCKTSGYYADPQFWLETFDYRPGFTPAESNGTMELPPAGLPDIFGLLGKVARHILDAISFSLNLRSISFTEILDNVPLRGRETSSSVLSVCCHSRPSFQSAQDNALTGSEDGQMVIFPEHEHQVEKSLITLVKSDRAGLHIKDFNGRWVLVDGDLGPQDVIVYPGLALFQATAGYVNPALNRTEIGSLEGHTYGRCSISFKLMPKSMASFSCSEMREAGHGVEAQFQLPIPVDDFMQRSHSAEQLHTKNIFPSYTFQVEQDGVPTTMKPLKRKKNITRKPLPPSKRLRLEAQRVLKERVQAIADKKGVRLRFCNLKECEGHIQSRDSPCGSIRMEIGWPAGVPFVHPHDLPNKSKLGFLEAYEPGWTAAQQDIENQSP